MARDAAHAIPTLLERARRNPRAIERKRELHRGALSPTGVNTVACRRALARGANGASEPRTVEQGEGLTTRAALVSQGRGAGTAWTSAGAPEQPLGLPPRAVYEPGACSTPPFGGNATWGSSSLGNVPGGVNSTGHPEVDKGGVQERSEARNEGRQEFRSEMGA